jgi:predicted DNA-binding protein with PD1-like motif
LKKWCTEQQIPVDEQLEVLSLAGDVARGDGEPAVHGHIVVGRRDGSTRGGHFVDGTVRPTLELVVQETPAYLQKRHDPESGLALIDPEADQ